MNRDEKIGLLVDFVTFLDNPGLGKRQPYNGPRSFSIVEWVDNGDSRMGYEGEVAKHVSDADMSDIITRFVDR